MLGGVKNAPRSFRVDAESVADAVTFEKLPAASDAAPKRMFAARRGQVAPSWATHLREECLCLVLDHLRLAIELPPRAAAPKALGYRYLRDFLGTTVIEPDSTLLVSKQVCIRAVRAMCNSERHAG
jgi:hypothetical protein